MVVAVSNTITLINNTETKGDSAITGTVTVGQLTQFSLAKSALNISGSTGSERSGSPDIIIKQDSSDHPIRHMMHWDQSTIYDIWGGYYNAGFKYGPSGDGWYNELNSSQNKYKIKVFSGGTAGNAISATEALEIDLTNGNVTAKEDLIVDGDVDCANLTVSTTSTLSGDVNIAGETTVNDTLTVGQTFAPSTGAALVNLSGTQSVSDRRLGPDISFRVDGLSRPIRQLFNYNYNNISDLVGCYYDNNYTAGHSGSGWRSWFNGTSDRQEFKVFAGQDVGANINSAFTESYHIDLSTGNVDFRQKVGINEDAPLNSLDVSGGVVIGSSFSGTKVSPTNGLSVEGKTYPLGGLVIQDGQNGGQGRGIYMWDAGTDWGVYMSSPGSGRSFSGSSAVPGHNFGSHCIRFRSNKNADNGFVFENSDDVLLSSINGSTGSGYYKGSLGVGVTTHVNKLDVGGAVAIGASAATTTAPADGLIIDGDIEFNGGGLHQIMNNTSGTGINIYNNSGWLKQTGWNGSYGTTVFKSRSDTGDHVIGANTSQIDDEEMLANKTGSGRNFGSINFWIDEDASQLHFKIRFTNESGKPISGITQANPAVVTASAHGYSNSDKVEILQVVGMTELNRNIYTVANVTTNTFELSGVDSSSFSAYTSGGSSNKIRIGDAQVAITGL